MLVEVQHSVQNLMNQHDVHAHGLQEEFVDNRGIDQRYDA